ncbi:MAG TPA: hypothetical protein VF123_02190 [Candidatus Sulfotelmatobacter sp.]
MAHNALVILKSELEFLDRGGYHRTVGSRQPLFAMESEPAWRAPLFFEDSPSCPKRRYEECTPERDCVLMDFVPQAFRQETLPCRHIPLNAKGDTVEGLAKSGRSKEIEPVLRAWLVKTIAELEAPVHS